MARLRQRLALLAGVLAGLIVMALAVLHLPSVRGRVLDRARAYAERELGVTLRASSLAYNLFTRTIELRDLSLASSSAPDPFLEADRAVVVLGPGMFLGRITVDRISLSRPRVTVIRYAPGVMNLPQSKSGADSHEPLRLGILSVTALSARLDDRIAQRSFTVGPVDLSVDVGGPSGRPGAFGPGAFTLNAGETTTGGTIAGRLAFDGTRLQIDQLTVVTKEGQAVLDGAVDLIAERPAVKARVTAAIDLAQSARLARVDAGGLTGRLDATIDAAGELTDPTVTLAVSSRDVRCPQLGVVRLTGRSTIRGGRAQIDNVEAISRVGTLQLQGVVDLTDRPRDTAPASRLTARWADVRIDDLVQVFGQSLPVRSGALAGGTGTAEFDVRDLQARAWSRLRLTAAMTMAPVRPAAGNTLGLSGKADLNVAEGRWSLLHVLNVQQARADLAGSATGRLLDGTDGFRSTLGGRSRLVVADVGALPPLMLAAGVKVPPEVAEGLGGSVDATIDLAGTIERPRARIDVDARDLRARVLPHAATLAARLDVDANGVRAERLQATAGSTSLQVSGRYAWDGPFDARFELNESDVTALSKMFDLPAAVGGTAKVEGTIAGTISGARRTGQAVLTLTARDLTAEGVSIGALTAKGTIPISDGGVAIVDAAAPEIGARAQIEIVNRAGYPVSGWVSLDHDRIGTLVPPRYRETTGDVTGTLAATARGSGLLSDPAGIRGRLDLRRVDVTIRGTRIALSTPGSVRVTQDRVAVDPLDLRIGARTRLTLAGQLGTTAVAEPLRFRLSGPLSETMEIGARTAGIAPVVVQGDGDVTLDVTVGGTLRRPMPIGTLALRSSSLQYGSLAPVTDLALDAAIDPTLITFRSLAAQWQGASLRGEGLLPWRVVLSSMQAPGGQAAPQSLRFMEWLKTLPAEPARARLTLRADNVTEAMLRDLVDPSMLEDVSAQAAVAIAAEADRLSLEGIQATVLVDRASATVAGVPFTQAVPTRLRLEKGRATIDSFRWTAEGNSIVATGGADLTAPEPSMDVGITGALDLRVLGAFVEGIVSGGTANADLRVTGPFANPDIVGRIAVADGELQIDQPRVAASDLEGTIQIAAGRKASVTMTGLVNTGEATLDGTLDLANLAAPLGTLHLLARGVALEYPSGLQTESNADISLALGATGSTLTGRVDVVGGTYREPIVLTTQLLSLSSASGIARAAPANDWLSRLRLNVTVATASDVRVDNNYGRFDVGANLRLVGTAASPGVLGRVQAAEDGEIFLGGNTYRIERLEIDLTNARSIAPDVNFSAQTRIGNMPIGVELRCPPSGACERKVTALAGGTDADAEARLFGTSGGATSAGEGLARLLSGEVLGVVGRTVGLDAIRLEQEAERRDIFDDPTLISGDVDPATRLTLAKRVGSNVELVYSQNLADDGFTWSTTYVGPYGLSWRLLLLDDESRSYEFRHEVGARARRPARAPGPRISAVTIAGSPGFAEDEIRRQLRLDQGDRFTFADWQRDRNRLEGFYHARGFLEARIRARRLSEDPAQIAGAPDADVVVLEYTIARGPATHLIVRGTTLPDGIRDRIAERWTSALFDGFLERDARTLVRDHVYRSGYLNATVTTVIAKDPSGESKTLTIDVAPGAVVSSRIETEGNAVIPGEQIVALATKADPLSPWLDAASVERLLEDHYRAEGYLAADVSVGAPVIRDGASVVTITVVEGAPYSIGQIEVSGLPDLPGQDMREELKLSKGDRYRHASVAGGVDRLETRLRRSAYRQARTEVDTRVDAKGATVDIAVRVTPGPRSILQDVVVQGGDREKSSIARSITLAPGAPLDPAAIRETRRRFYDLDVYRTVDIDVQPVQPAASAAPANPPAEQPVIARINLVERPRYRFRYGLAVSDEPVSGDERDRRLGFAADLENRNMFGSGASAALSMRLRRDQQVGRVSVGARRFFGLPIRSTLFVEREREKLNPDGAFPITSDISAVTAEQAYRIRRSIEVRYGYGIERNHTFIRDAAADPFDLTVKVARFTSSGLVDRRDDPFDPARGWFASSTMELSMPGLGSDLRFLKNFAQYSRFDGVSRTMVLASAARLGLARTFKGEVLIPSERFFAGGATSVRGYREDDLGARSVFDDAEGGSALLVLNGELRFPIYRWLKGVGFVDVGNVYPTVSDISFADLQFGVGGGARLDTPFGLFRVDLGIPANRRSFDPRWRVHIGLGHGF